MSGFQVPPTAARTPGPLTPEEFARRFQAASRVLWTVAAGALGKTSEVEDVLQEAALMALDKLDRFDPGTNFTAWAARFVQNVARNHRRKSVRRRTLPTAPEDLAGLEGTRASEPEFSLAGRVPVTASGELRAGTHSFDDAVLSALGELTDTARSCLLLRTLLELGYGEISDVLGIPEGTAMSHVHRARAAMRAKLQDREHLGSEAGR